MAKKMKLKDLVKDIAHNVIQGSDDLQVSGLAIDSRNAEKNFLFIAVKGYNKDGHEFIPMAYERGATAFLIDTDREKSAEAFSDGLIDSDDITIISVNNTRDVLSKISNRYHNDPADNFNLIGVTGTNGKTSVTVILDHVLKKLGRKTGLIGTISTRCGDDIIDFSKTTPTTPDCIELAKMFEYMADNGVEDVIMEVSSMGLKTKRVASLLFDVGIFTNISPEHLDDHKTMKDYQDSKLMLFKRSGKTVVNMDDDYAQNVVDVSGPCLKYGIRKKGPCDLVAESISYYGDGVSFRMMYGIEQFMVKLKVPSEFAVYNALAVVGACIQLGIPFKDLEEPIQDEILIPGRYDIVSTPGGYTGIIDYAHTEVALKNLLYAVTSNPSYNSVISVFGCGGDRDPHKRGHMGRISGEIADYTIITSDNPRSEDPQKIIDMIETGIKETEGDYEVINDRKDAIKKAIEIAEEGDAIVISGKGHETYQILGEITIDFDDKEVFCSFI